MSVSSCFARIGAKVVLAIPILVPIFWGPLYAQSNHGDESLTGTWLGFIETPEGAIPFAVRLPMADEQGERLYRLGIHIRRLTSFAARGDSVFFGLRPPPIPLSLTATRQGDLMEGRFVLGRDALLQDGIKVVLARRGSSLAEDIDLKMREMPESMLADATGYLQKMLWRCVGPEEVDETGDFPPSNQPDTFGAGLVSLINDHQELCEETEADGCLVIYRGQIVQECYSGIYGLPIPNMSSMKSWTSILAGILLADGKIESIDEPVANYIPEWKAGAEADVTLRHLLTMTSGIAQLEDESTAFAGGRDYNAVLFTLPIENEPGTTWDYSNEGAQLLSPVLERAAGMPLQDFARQRLFEPLGMRDTHLLTDERGQASTSASALTSLRDFGKLALLMLNEGRWGDEQIVPAAWVQLSTKPIPQRSEKDYGLLWWLIPELNGFWSNGFLGNHSYVFPEQGLVFARMKVLITRESKGRVYDEKLRELVHQFSRK